MTKSKFAIKIKHNNIFSGEIVKRAVKCEQVSNFDLITCVYKGEKYVVYSDVGDLSDPFRRNNTYLDSLYINT